MTIAVSALRDDPESDFGGAVGGDELLEGHSLGSKLRQVPVDRAGAVDSRPSGAGAQAIAGIAGGEIALDEAVGGSIDHHRQLVVLGVAVERIVGSAAVSAAVKLDVVERQVIGKVGCAGQDRINHVPRPD